MHRTRAELKHKPVPRRTQTSRSNVDERAWVNSDPTDRLGAVYSGDKQSGIGRETVRLTLDHLQQSNGLLVSFSEDSLGFV